MLISLCAETIKPVSEGEQNLTQLWKEMHIYMWTQMSTSSETYLAWMFTYICPWFRGLPQDIQRVCVHPRRACYTIERCAKLFFSLEISSICGPELRRPLSKTDLWLEQKNCYTVLLSRTKNPMLSSSSSYTRRKPYKKNGLLHYRRFFWLRIPVIQESFSPKKGIPLYYRCVSPPPEHVSPELLTWGTQYISLSRKNNFEGAHSFAQPERPSFYALVS